VVIDVKDNLLDNRSREDGNLAALNHTLSTVFRSSLFRADSVGVRGSEWPALAAMDGKVLVVLSGHHDTRLGYTRDIGASPAVAMNTRGVVVEVHDDGRDDLWYWTGNYQAATGQVHWRGHARYDSGRTPAVAMDSAGVVVEVHRDDDSFALWYRVGQARADGTGIDFGDSHRFDTGRYPSIAFIGPGQVREVHQSQNNNQRWFNTGVVDSATWTIQWNAHDRTGDPFYVRDAVTLRVGGNDRTVAVATTENGGYLRYSTDRLQDQPIRYEPLAFVEVQMGDDGEVPADRHFFAAEVGGGGVPNFVEQWRNRGGLVRLWGYNQEIVGVLPNFPATDQPFAQWYLRLLRRIDAVDAPE